MIILDTNVISETFRPRPDPGVILWLDEQDPVSLHLCAPVLAELHYGAARLKPSVRQQNLMRLISELATELFSGRIIPFDWMAAIAYGLIVSGREAAGRPISVIDAMIAAIAQSNNATLATRNTADFEQTGITLVNPFSEPTAP